MALGYSLPGTQITDNTTPNSVVTTSSQRRPCFIGLASPHVAVLKEAVTRASGNTDSLANSSYGIYNVTAVGSNSGMNNLKENIHWQLVSDQISWLPKVQNAESAVISNIVTPISYAVTIETPVAGEDATSGYATISTSPTAIVSSVSTGLVAGNYNLSIAVDGATAQVSSVTIGAASTWSDVITALNSGASPAFSGVTASIVSGKIVFTASSTGASSTVVVSDGTTNGLLASISGIGKNFAVIDTAVAGTTTSTGTYGYQTISSLTSLFSGASLARIAAGTYSLNVAANGLASNSYPIVITGSETWAQVAATMSTSFAAVATVSIVSDKIEVKSKITGVSSSISMTEGTTFGFIAAINAVTGLYIVATPVSAVGIAATSGYCELVSSPSEFVATSYCNVESGQYVLSVNINNAGAAQKSFQVMGATETWSNVVSDFTISGATVSIVNNKIRVTSTSTGIASSIVIADGTTAGSVIAFINALNTLTATNITVTVPALQFVRTATETHIDFILGATTYTYTIQTPITDAQTSLTIYGTNTALKALSAGSVLNLTSVGNWLSEGAVYYVSYNYIRPDSDYMVYKEFNDFNAVKADLGADIGSNPVVNLCKLALTVYGVPSIAVVQLKTSTKSNFAAALDVIKYKNVQTVLPLSSDPDVRSYVVNHVTERSLPATKRYRMCYVGAPAGTPVGDESTANSLRGIASTIKNKRAVLVNATRGIYYYNDATGTEQSILVDGSFIAAAVGAYRDSFVNPTTTMLNKSIPGITLLADDYDDYYNEYMLTQAGSSSVLLLTPSAAGGMLVMDDLTTNNNTVETSNINIVTVEDYIASDVIVQMNKNHGRLIKDKKSYADGISKQLTKLFAEYQRNQIIASVGYTTAAISAARGDTVLISYGYYAIYTHKYTEGTYEILV